MDSILSANIQHMVCQERPEFIMTIDANYYNGYMSGTGLVNINWGDGTNTDYILDDGHTNTAHNYPTSGIRTIIVTNPSNVLEFWLYGITNTTFNWSEILKMRLTNADLDNTMITGTLVLPEGMIYCGIHSGNTLSGTLHLPISMISFKLLGDNSLSGYTTQAFSNNMNYFHLVTDHGTGFTAAEVDQLCIDLDGSAWSGADRTLILTGTSMAAPTAASLSARNSLIAKSVAVTVNP